MTESNPPHTKADQATTRQRWLKVMAMTPPALLNEAIGERLHNETFVWLRRPETGLYRVQGRLDGAGNRFNLADIVVTRSVVRSAYETAGVGYIQGRSTLHSTLVARMDSLLQTPAFESSLMAEVIHPLAECLHQRWRAEREETERSRVHFYTMTPETL